MDANIEISRAVSMLRSVMRTEIENCIRAISAGDNERARKEVSEMGDKLKRVVNVLNCLR